MLNFSKITYHSPEEFRNIPGKIRFSWDFNTVMYYKLTKTGIYIGGFFNCSEQT